jgi:hypothetical protein
MRLFEEQTMPRTDNARKLCPLNIRTTKERRERLEAAALENGLSLTAQVERYLDFAMDFDAIKQAILKEQN